MYQKVFLILFGIILLPCALAAQDHYALRTFTTKDGLPHNQVRSIAQDSTGFIWIATWDGLSRYDGYEFKNYYHNPIDSTSIPYFSVETIIVDHFNNMWIGSDYRNAVCYNRAKDNFKVMVPIEKNSITKENSDPTGHYWQFDAVDGLKKFDDSRKELISFKVMDLEGNRIVHRKLSANYFVFDNLGRIWIFIENVVTKVINIYLGIPADNESFSFRTFSMLSPTVADPGSPAVYTTLFVNPYVSPSGKIYLFSNWGLFNLNIQTGIVSKISQPIPMDDFMGNFPFIWSPDNFNVYHYNPANKTLDSICDKTRFHIQNIFKDKKGNFWIYKLKKSGEGTGVTEAIPTPAFFNHYLLEYDSIGNTNAYFAIIKDRFNNIWAAARNLNYIFKISPDRKNVKVNKLKDKVWKQAWHPRSFLEDSTGIWIGYFRNLLMYYDFKSRKFSVKYYNTNEAKSNEMLVGFENLIKNENEILGSSSGQINSFRLRERETVSLRKFTDDSIKYGMYKLIKAADGSFYSGHNYGIVRQFDEKFSEKNKWKVGNGIYNVEDICVGDHDDLWLSLLGGGLAHLFMGTGKTEYFTTADGLSNNTCYSILKDKKGNLWISTNHGISRFNTETRQFRTFDASDGLKIDEFNSDASYQAPDGEMFFGGMGGIVSFYPDSLKENEVNQKPVRLVITDFRVSGMTRYFDKAVYDMDTVSLSKGDNNFQVTFACLDFQNPEKIKYRYRLSGQNSHWTETNWRHRFVNYANLTPGSYFLEIEATNRNGDWVSNTSLLIIIPPYYYQTLWFRLMVLAGFILLTGFLISGYISRIRLQAKKKQEELKLESLRGQMNPHFIFNSLNSINYFIAQNDRLSANRYIADFSRLIRSILGNLSSDYIPFSKELESLHDYLKLEYLRFGDKFEYKVQVPGGMESSEIKVFPGMVQPFVENAIWHGVRGLEGRKGWIRIVFTRQHDGSLQCMIEDDGVGRKRAEEKKSELPGKTSRGIGIVLERLRIINNLKKTNYRIVIEDLNPGKEETGTRVIIDIPVKP